MSSCDRSVLSFAVQLERLVNEGCIDQPYSEIREMRKEIIDLQNTISNINCPYLEGDMSVAEISSAIQTYDEFEDTAALIKEKLQKLRELQSAYNKSKSFDVLIGKLEKFHDQIGPDDNDAQSKSSGSS
jgi:hypothetical protein